MTGQPLDPILELGRINLGEFDLDGVLAQVAGIAVRSVPGAEVSVTLIRTGRPRTVTSTGDAALRVDRWQYEHGAGPCLEAAATHGLVRVDDVAAERRWPGWPDSAIEAGVCSALSVGLPVQEQVVGALNMYAAGPGAFGPQAVRLAGTFARYAAVALANAHLYDSTVTLARQMRIAMESRAVIEQAKGIIMSQRRCGADEAFAILSRASQESNRKLREVAQSLVDRTRP